MAALSFHCATSDQHGTEQQSRTEDIETDHPCTFAYAITSYLCPIKLLSWSITRSLKHVWASLLLRRHQSWTYFAKVFISHNWEGIN
ncbi:hypothetical protein EON65_08605 [archaeon]|nr:MAG: hypothetical protein EON65_08605 [archaeon]